MTVVNAASTPPAMVIVLGRIPPPVTGMTLFTKEILERLRHRGPVEFVNWSVGAARRTPLTRLRYIGKAIASLVYLLRRGRVQERRLYLMANSGAGLYLTALLASVAARLGYTVYLHHHVYDYIERYDPRMARIVRRMGVRGVHVVACQRMMRDFCCQYHNDQRFAILRPSAVQIEVGVARAAFMKPFRLGMLSNLSLAKGLKQAIDTFTSLHAVGRPVTLTLAGPTLDGVARQIVEQTVASYPTVVAYLGPVYGEAKQRFFDGIDAFLFPTQRESWGIVLHESLAAGVPVIVNDRGCTGVVVGERAGLMVHEPQDYVVEAACQVERWLDHPDQYAAASAAAIEQADFLNREGRRTLDEFAAHMFSPLGAVDGLLQSR